jgi:hypothetical protein
MAQGNLELSGDLIIDDVFDVYETGGAGDCLFYSLGFATNDNTVVDAEQAHSLRLIICKNHEIEINGLNVEENWSNDVGGETYVINSESRDGSMCKQGEWGSEIEIIKAARILNRPIILYKKDYVAGMNVNLLREPGKLETIKNGSFCPQMQKYFIDGEFGEVRSRMVSYFLPEKSVNDEPILILNKAQAHYQVLIPKSHHVSSSAASGSLANLAVLGKDTFYEKHMGQIKAILADFNEKAMPFIKKDGLLGLIITSYKKFLPLKYINEEVAKMKLSLAAAPIATTSSVSALPAAAPSTTSSSVSALPAVASAPVTASSSVSALPTAAPVAATSSAPVAASSSVSALPAAAPVVASSEKIELLRRELYWVIGNEVESQKIIDTAKENAHISEKEIDSIYSSIKNLSPSLVSMLKKKNEDIKQQMFSAFNKASKMKDPEGDAYLDTIADWAASNHMSRDQAHAEYTNWVKTTFYKNKIDF